MDDATALDLLHENPSFPQWARAKRCDTFGPVGPVIATGLASATLTVRTLLNGRERRNYPIAEMMFSLTGMVSLLSRETTLMPGASMACGTSLSVLPLRPGKEVTIDGIGDLTNTMAAKPETKA